MNSWHVKFEKFVVLAHDKVIERPLWGSSIISSVY